MNSLFVYLRSDAHEREYDALCAGLFDLQSAIGGLLAAMARVKAALPRFFSIGLCGLFVAAAIVFDRINNFFLMYFLTTILLLSPGLQAKGVWALAHRQGHHLYTKIRDRNVVKPHQK